MNKAFKTVTGLMGVLMVIRSSHLATFKSPSSTPREGCSYTFEEASNPVFYRFPGAKGRERGFTVIRVGLTDEACITVTIVSACSLTTKMTLK
ncbi:hypothetical protein THARTR1_10814 [Trichoderma harzianum]|uniref:Secreted protein n=1 Tax=Trichoderma harzianum TaxID=5544 RepID=A0A2K0TKF5_TRIHA|nr:hypothetical protein THARTR1_10814 [Trichoderma harzianum]